MSEHEDCVNNEPAATRAADPGPCDVWSLGGKAKPGDTVYCRNHLVEFEAPISCPRGRAAIREEYQAAAIAWGEARLAVISFHPNATVDQLTALLDTEMIERIRFVAARTRLRSVV